MKIDDGVIVNSPARSFTQAVCHLIDNACKFSPEGGLVKINLEANGHNGTKMTVQDQGPGIPREMREIVFDRFFQLQEKDALPENHGMGLGLFMARSFARTLEGDVHILDSDLGCTIQLRLKNRPDHSS